GPGSRQQSSDRALRPVGRRSAAHDDRTNGRQICGEASLTDGIGDTPLTERYFDTSLLRLASRLLPLIDLSQRPPPVEAALILQTLPSPPDAEQMWTAFDAVGRYLEATQAPGAEYTNPELMLVAICKVRSLL